MSKPALSAREAWERYGRATLQSPRGRWHQRCAFNRDLADFDSNMNIETIHIGMKVRHPQYGVGVVKSLTEQTAEIAFDDAPRTIAPASSDLQPAEATASLSELEMPLANLIRDTAHAMVEALGLEQKDVLVEGLATRWQRGTLVMQSADSSLQPKEVPLETFFHKIVMIRNNLRVLEQKVNASDKLSDGDNSDIKFVGWQSVRFHEDSVRGVSGTTSRKARRR